MNKNLLMSVLVVMVAAALINLGTISYFSDEDVKEGNILQAGDLDLKFVGPGSCDLELSFLYEDNFVGVDDTTGWSTDTNRADLGVTEFDIFNGTGKVYAQLDTTPKEITQRGWRGLGVIGGGDDDEIDYRAGIDSQEKIYIEFDTPKWLCKFEVRSLYEDEGENGEEEVGDVRLWLAGETVADFHFEADVPSDENGTKVVDTENYLVDKIMFHIDQSNPFSDFSPARLYFADYCMQDNEYFDLLGATWQMTHMKPGMEDNGTIVFNEDGSNMGNYLDFTCDYKAYEDDDGDRTTLNPGPEPDTDLDTGIDDTSNDTFASFMEITKMDYHCDSGNVYDILTQIQNNNVNGYKDLQDLKDNPTPPSVTLNDNGVNGDYLVMTIRFHQDAGNEYQGDIFDFWIIFTLRYQ